jgi:hypothetical protein
MSIMILITRTNTIRNLLGLDGFRLIWYCLIIRYQNTKAYSAGILAVLSN